MRVREHQRLSIDARTAASASGPWIARTRSAIDVEIVRDEGRAFFRPPVPA
ncbi:MAG: hypothetical protein U0234_31435 [Sandaracinus sp.]